MRLISAGEADLPFVMETERLPGYEALVGRWERDRHLAAMADGRHAYFLAEVAGQPAGFAILRDWDGPEKVVCLKRIAVARSGEGRGRKFLALLADAVFGRTDAYRFWLGVFPENDRGRRAYAAAGFREEGVARGSAFFAGRHRDELVMAMLRPEWQALRSAPA